MKPHIEISKQLQDLYGNNRIVIGKAGEKIYFDLPDSPEVFAHLIKKMLMAMGQRGMEAHLDALTESLRESLSPPAVKCFDTTRNPNLAQQMEEIISPPEDA